MRRGRHPALQCFPRQRLQYVLVSCAQRRAVPGASSPRRSAAKDHRRCRSVSGLGTVRLAVTGEERERRPGLAEAAPIGRARSTTRLASLGARVLVRAGRDPVANGRRVEEAHAATRPPKERARRMASARSDVTTSTTRCEREAVPIHASARSAARSGEENSRTTSVRSWSARRRLNPSTPRCACGSSPRRNPSSSQRSRRGSCGRPCHGSCRDPRARRPRRSSR